MDYLQSIYFYIHIIKLKLVLCHKCSVFVASTGPAPDTNCHNVTQLSHKMVTYDTCRMHKSLQHNNRASGHVHCKVRSMQQTTHTQEYDMDTIMIDGRRGAAGRVK